jgi:hypothetical protein
VPPPRAASAASILDDWLERLYELVVAPAIEASVEMELVESVPLETWYVVMAPFAVARALSTLKDEPTKLVLETWFPVMLLVVVARAPSTLIDDVERLVELWFWTAIAASTLDDWLE